jgi:hypothetical protein
MVTPKRTTASKDKFIGQFESIAKKTLLVMWYVLLVQTLKNKEHMLSPLMNLLTCVLGKIFTLLSYKFV